MSALLSRMLSVLLNKPAGKHPVSHGFASPRVGHFIELLDSVRLFSSMKVIKLRERERESKREREREREALNNH